MSGTLNDGKPRTVEDSSKESLPSNSIPIAQTGLPIERGNLHNNDEVKYINHIYIEMFYYH